MKTTPDITPLRCIELLGGLRLHQNQTETTRFRTQKTAALLAFLALHPHQNQAREELIERFWPDADFEAGRTSLRTALSALRQQLEPPPTPEGSILLADRLTVRLNPKTTTTDVAQMETSIQQAAQATDPATRIAALIRAVELYRGPLLPGFYEDWALLERERLLTVHFRALRELVEALGASGQVEIAIPYAQRAIQLDSLNEEAHLDLMRLYAASGQAAALNRQYKEMERTLRRELDAGPAQETKAEYQRLLKVRPVREVKTAPVEAREEADEQQKPYPTNEMPALESRPPTSAPLPTPLTRFFGREKEIAELLALLKQEETSAQHPTPNAQRLLTLTGPGGSGKSRLALEVAQKFIDSVGEVVAYVPLQDMTDASLLPGAILQALSLPPSTEQEPLDQVCEALARYPYLLILDNFEQVVEEGAGVVQELLARAPTLRCLVTSRQRLDMGGEREFPVPPLPVPSLPGSPETLAEVASVQLFLNRAQAARPDFRLTRENAAMISALCEHLEGIPLALELAAPWAQTLTPAQMLARLSQRFDLLTSRRRDLPSRHRTLRSAIESSVLALEPALQAFFGKLSVFRGGWTLDAAEVVCEEPFAFDYLAQLRERSLLMADVAGTEMRYRFLETLRAYAAELLDDSAREAQERRHSDYYLRLAEEGEPHLTGARQIEWRERLDPEQENFRIALARLQQQRDQERGLRLVSALTPYWNARGEPAEGLRWYEGFDPDSPNLSLPTRARALFAAGELHEPRGNLEETLRWKQQSLECYREIGDKRNVARVLRRVFHDVFLAKTHDGTKLLDEALQLSREANDQSGVAEGLSQMAGYYRDNLDNDRAVALYEESLTLYRALQDDFGIAHVQREIAYLYSQIGKIRESIPLIQEVLEAVRRMRNRPAIAHNLWLLGRAQQMVGDLAAGQATLRECAALSDEIGMKQLVVNAWSDMGIEMKNRGRYAEAADYFTRALAVCREMNSLINLLRPLWNLAENALLMHDTVTTRRTLLEGLDAARSTGNLHYRVYYLALLAEVAFQAGQTERAALAYGTVLAQCEALGIPPREETRPHYRETREAIEAELGSEGMQAALQRGRAMTIEEAVALLSS